MKISLPYNYEPRDYQRPVWEAFDYHKKKRFYTLWHRRSGKDINWWNLLIREAASGQVGLYYHFLPTGTQGKKVIWDGITNHGRKFLDYIPEGLIISKNDTEMKVGLKNGSIIQVIGTDHYDSIRGTNPIGCVFSEFAYQHPMAWEIVKPILNANGGWAAFDTTPNGNNHAKKLWNIAQSSPDWFTSKVTIRDTNIVSQEVIEQERKEGTTEEMIQQEYYCSFEAGMVGAFYAQNINQVYSGGRYAKLEVEEAPVDVFMDLGKTDTMSIGFAQFVGNRVHVIDYYENNLQDIEHYVKVLKGKPYKIGTLYLPHDAFAKRLESAQTVAQQFQANGFQVSRVPSISIGNGIQLTRKILPRTYFNSPNTEKLLEALESYHKEYDLEKKVYKENPVHDWSSHPSDMFRYLAVIAEEATPMSEEEYKRHHAGLTGSYYEETDKLKILDQQMRDFLEGKPQDTYQSRHDDYLRSLEEQN